MSNSIDHLVNQVWCADALEFLREFPPGSVCIISDPPYGTTASKRDNAIDPETLWPLMKSASKPGRAIVLTSIQPYSSCLVIHAGSWFKWSDVWVKSHATGHLNCHVMPLRAHEDILVFGKGKVYYSPIIGTKAEQNIRPESRYGPSACYGSYGLKAKRTISKDQTYPKSVVHFDSPNHGEKGFHEHQKPLRLMKYLIDTYTTPDNIVFDFACGSGTTLVAADQLGRRWIGVDKDPSCCTMARDRIKRETSQRNLFLDIAAAKATKNA